MTERIKQLLNELYSLEDAETAYEVLMQMVENFETKPSEAHDVKILTEQDVMLITYADTLQRINEKPLHTLNQFACKYLLDAISAIHILPFYPFSSDDGFSITDFYSVNPAVGDWSHVEQLSHHFDLMLDAVLNHMSAQSEWFQNFLADDPDYAGLFRTESPKSDLSSITRPRSHPLLTAFAKTSGETAYLWTTFSADQIDFDVRSPYTLLRLLDILLFYVQKGARFIRLDAIAYLWKEVGTSSIHLQQTHAIIQLMRALLDAVAPYVIIITETNVPHQENISYFGDGSNEAQLVYNFTLPPLLFHTLLSGNSKKLRHWVNKLQTPSAATAFFNFTASHDGIGVRPVEGVLDENELNNMIEHTLASGGRVSYKQNGDGSESPYELNISYVDAIIDQTEPPALQAKRFILSQAVALSLAGLPAIYIHSLLGSHNDIEGMEKTKRNRSINRSQLSADKVIDELADPSSFRAGVFHPYKRLIQIRRQQPAFHPNASQQAIDIQDLRVFGLLRTASNDQQKILAIYNITSDTIALDLSEYIEATARDLISNRIIGASVTLSPYEILWLELP